MRCPYCAEEIQDAAILCRFCGAHRTATGWQPPALAQSPPLPSSFPAPYPTTAPPPIPAQKNWFEHISIRTAALFFFFSAISECSSITSAVPLFGALRPGFPAILYHIFFSLLYLAMGSGLWQARPWGYWLIWWGTIIYTLDRVLYFFDHAARAQMRDELQDALQMIDWNAGTVFWMYIAFSLACWWAFVLYVYQHRPYFQIPQAKK